MAKNYNNYFYCYFFTSQLFFSTLHNNDRIVVNKFIYRIAEPKRGDIVVFTPPMVDSKTRYIKRIVGLPGESVQIREGKVYINRIELIEPYLSQIETPGIVGPVVLEADEFFVLGDHRNNSMDSRDFGPVNKDLIYGKTMFILWPVKDFHVFGKEKYELFEEQSTSFKKDQPPVPLV